MLSTLFSKLFGDPTSKMLKAIQPLVQNILDFEQKFDHELLKDEDFSAKTVEFKARLKNGEKLDDLLPEAFALVKIACKRNVGRKWIVRGHEVSWDMVPFDVQLLGGIVLHKGNISEMKTGEGKTLVCVMPVYLNALTEKGVFVVTVNEYLAQRDAEWMGGIYRFLGLSVGVILHDQSHEEKKQAYSADVIYGTNNEFGFDYLRDNMAVNPNHIVQRDLFFSIVDEVDSILIDEARTPLIISAPAEESTSKYLTYDRIIGQLEEKKDYIIDEKLKTAALTEEGIATLEQLMGVSNIYTDAGFEEVHHIEQALKARACYKKDIDYVVKEDEIIIVDEFTGRLMPGRRYSDGLHQAIEAKEKVEIKRESRTLATITFQNYFRLFKKLAGMTGTALTEAEEFYKIYGLDVIAVPTNRAVHRDDYNDIIYKSQKGKFLAVTKKVKELYEKGQPVLVGTISIEKSEVLSQLFTIHGVPHTVLNAKHHQKEAEIITKAGQSKAVTIATNMAGRGTDIKLGAGVTDVGGLFVLGTERHESRRIDNQLRGRSGRQGDPGASQFFVSMEDELMRLFGGERVKNIMEVLKVPEDMPIENKIITRSIEGAQKRVEGHNFDIRKHVVEYDNVMNKHREIIYSRRRKILLSDNIKNDIIILIEKEAERLVLSHIEHLPKSEWDYQKIVETVNALGIENNTKITVEQITRVNEIEEIIEIIKLHLFQEYEKKEKELPDASILRQIERSIYLQIIDRLWMEHIDDMSHLREAVSLHGYGHRDPLIEYQREGFMKFKQLLENIQSNTVSTLFKLEIERQIVPEIQKMEAEEPVSMMTNLDQIESSLTGGAGELSSEEPRVIKVSGPSAPIKQEKVGRNEPCPCGSGKKFKKCHGK